MATTTRHSTDLPQLSDALRHAWSQSTSADPAGWSADNPAWGQCAVSALVVQDALGGELLRARVNGISHYWNRLPSGEQIDLTLEQFKHGVSVESDVEVRSREYVLSFPATLERYEQVRGRLSLR